MKKVVVRVRSVGQSFGCVGEVFSPRGKRALAQTDVLPYGMRGVAYERAEAIAAERGWEVLP